MRFLLDMPVSFLLLDVLQIHGHEGVHAHRKLVTATYYGGRQSRTRRLSSAS